MKILFPLIAATMVIVAGCHEDEQQVRPVSDNGPSDLKPGDSRSGNSTASLLSTTSGHYTDWSGQVHIEITTTETSLGHHHRDIAAGVPPDYVLIGGGAWVAEDDYVDAGALLTESRPDLNLQQWWASSKDHVDSDVHKLFVYSIGLRIDGIDKTSLMNYITVRQSTSGVASSPSTSAAVPYPYKLIGGGARANWNTNGSLLVRSYPSGTQWNVRSKDHIRAEATNITAYAIGIQEYIPGFGYLDVDIFPGAVVSGNPLGHQTTSYTLPYGYVMACPGVNEQFDSAAGRLVTGIGIEPDGYTVKVASKDHKRADESQLQAYAIGIRKRP